MSSSPTAPTSTTGSSTCSRSRADAVARSRRRLRRPRPAACARIVARRGWPVDVHPLPPLLHNQPQLIAGEVAELAASCATLRRRGRRLRRLRHLRRARRGLRRLGLRAGRAALLRRVRRRPRCAAVLEDEPGTYLLTDFLVRSFERTVWRELGLDRYPELRDDYFRHYTRVVWLAQRPTPATRAAARACGGAARPAARSCARSATGGLERELERVLGELTLAAR